MARVVLDTNVVVSAALKSAGNERRAIEALSNSRSILVMSPALLAEYEQVIARRKFRKVHAELKALVVALSGAAYHVTPDRAPRVSPDAADDMVLACAEAGAADYLVTGNLKDFPATWKGTRILNARAFLVEIARTAR